MTGKNKAAAPVAALKQKAEAAAEAKKQKPARVPSHIEDLVFWATAFWQEQKTEGKGKNEIITTFLPDEGAQAIAEALHAIGHDEITAENVQATYAARA